MPETFVIMEEQSLVQLDLAEQLLEIAPDSAVLSYRTVADALPALSKMPSLTGAILGAHGGEMPAREFVDHDERLNAWLACTTNSRSRRGGLAPDDRAVFLRQCDDAVLDLDEPPCRSRPSVTFVSSVGHD